jgi:hypothetical protein
MNLSKATDPRSWKCWDRAGAVDHTFTVKKMGKAVFAFDPFIGCPFDDSELVMVENHDSRSVGERVKFKGPNKLGTRVHPIKNGKIVAIGANAKYLNGERFTAFAVQSAGGIRFMTEKDFLPCQKYTIVKSNFAIMPRDIPGYFDHLWEAFENSETEISAAYILRFCQTVGSWKSFTYNEINRYFQNCRGMKSGSFTFNRLVEPGWYYNTPDESWLEGGGWIVHENDRYYITDDFIRRVHKAAQKDH